MKPTLDFFEPTLTFLPAYLQLQSTPWHIDQLISPTDPSCTGELQGVTSAVLTILHILWFLLLFDALPLMNYNHILINRPMYEWWFRPQFSTAKASLGQGQQGLTRWIFGSFMLTKSNLLTCSPACCHCAIAVPNYLISTSHSQTSLLQYLFNITHSLVSHPYAYNLVTLHLWFVPQAQYCLNHRQTCICHWYLYYF